MAHMILEKDSMMSVREKPWHYGDTYERTNIIMEYQNVHDALISAGLNWTVIQQDVVAADTGEIIPGYKLNYVDEKNIPLAIVSNQYKIVQNETLGEIGQAIADNKSIKVETAGSMNNCKRVWILLKMPEAKVAGDDVEPYMCLTNTFDASGAIKVCMTPIRVVCNNTLNCALSRAKRSWSTRHRGNMEAKIEEAKETLQLANRYMTELDEYAAHMIDVRVDDDMLKKVLDHCFPVSAKATDREKATIEARKEQYMVCYFRPDIAKFAGTAWGAINAMSDFVGHTPPVRNTKNYEENRWISIMDGAPLLDRMTTAIRELA